jgi:hypothetical protein
MGMSLNSIQDDFIGSAWKKEGLWNIVFIWSHVLTNVYQVSVTELWVHLLGTSLNLSCLNCCWFELCHKGQSCCQYMHSMI